VKQSRLRKLRAKNTPGIEPRAHARTEDARGRRARSRGGDAVPDYVTPVEKWGESRAPRIIVQKSYGNERRPCRLGGNPKKCGCWGAWPPSRNRSRSLSSWASRVALPLLVSASRPRQGGAHPRESSRDGSARFHVRTCARTCLVCVHANAYLTRPRTRASSSFYVIIYTYVLICSLCTYLNDKLHQSPIMYRLSSFGI